MTNVVCLPGVERNELPAGSPRPDMAAMFRELADRADAGEFDACALCVSLSSGSIITAVSTPENSYYALLGGLHDVMRQVVDRRPDEQPTMTKDYEP